MNRISIDEFTDQIIPLERFYSYLAWKSGRNFGIQMSKKDLEDIVSDAYLTAASRIQNDENLKINDPKAWFARIVYFTAIIQKRKEIRRKKFVDKSSIEELENTNFVYDTFEKFQNEDFLRKLIDENLSEDERKLLHMNIQGYSYEEISQVLNKNQSAVRKMKSRVVEKLRKLL